MRVAYLFPMIMIVGFLIMGSSTYSADIENLLTNSYFAEGIAGWTLECHDPFVRADIEPDPDTKVIGDYSLKTDLQEIQVGAEIWRCQPKQTGLGLKGGQKYTWSFWAKAAEERQLQCQVLVDVWNWRLLGLDQPVNITTEWKEYFHTFTATEDYANSRITWLCAHETIDFWIDNVILYEGDYVEELMADEVLQKPQLVTQKPVLASAWGKIKSE